MGVPASHPAAELFPLLGEPELRELAVDIRANGQRVPIVLYGGAVLDGRNRLRACELAGVTPRFEEFTGGDPVAYVVSVNIRRRHLDGSQRAMVGARLLPMLEEEARRRQVATRIRDGRAPVRANLPAPWDSGRARDHAAALVRVSPRSIESAARVVSEAAPELAQAVDRGTVAVSTAAVLVQVPPDQQRELVARGERAILAAARDIKAGKAEARRAERFARLAEISRGNVPLELGAERGPWPIVLADPPWEHEHSSIEKAVPYPTMTLEAICALPVASVVTPAAVLFLWAPVPKLAEAMRVIDAWGFDYRTGLVWVKDRIGLGCYVRQRAEVLLLAVRGAMPAPSPANRPDNVFEAGQREHSRKPDEAYALVERMYPGLPRVELFARQAWPGWDAWGNQAPAGPEAAAC